LKYFLDEEAEGNPEESLKLNMVNESQSLLDLFIYAAGSLKQTKVIAKKSSNDEAKASKPSNKYRDQFTSFIRIFFDKYAPSAHFLNITLNYHCEDADYFECMKVYSHTLHEFLFFGLNHLKLSNIVVELYSETGIFLFLLGCIELRRMNKIEIYNELQMRHQWQKRNFINNSRNQNDLVWGEELERIERYNFHYYYYYNVFIDVSNNSTKLRYNTNMVLGNSK